MSAFPLGICLASALIFLLSFSSFGCDGLYKNPSLYINLNEVWRQIGFKEAQDNSSLLKLLKFEEKKYKSVAMISLSPHLGENMRTFNLYFPGFKKFFKDTEVEFVSPTCSGFNRLCKSFDFSHVTEDPSLIKKINKVINTQTQGSDTLVILSPQGLPLPLQEKILHSLQEENSKSYDLIFLKEAVLPFISRQSNPSSKEPLQHFAKMRSNPHWPAKTFTRYHEHIIRTFLLFGEVPSKKVAEDFYVERASKEEFSKFTSQLINPENPFIVLHFNQEGLREKSGFYLEIIETIRAKNNKVNIFTINAPQSGDHSFVVSLPEKNMKILRRSIEDSIAVFSEDSDFVHIANSFKDSKQVLTFSAGSGSASERDLGQFYVDELNSQEWAPEETLGEYKLKKLKFLMQHMLSATD